MSQTHAIHAGSDVGEPEPGRVERQRERALSTLFDPLTERALTCAGLDRGMRVVDCGCGTGDVSLLAARIVGPTGSVLGIDRAADALGIARRRAAERGLPHVSFVEADLSEVVIPDPVDAIVGRRVLQYLPNRIGALRRLSAFVRPGGLLCFQEVDLLGTQSLPSGPLFEQCRAWLAAALSYGLAELQMGLKLRDTFVAAGLPAPAMVMGARVEGGWDTLAYDGIAQTIADVLPVLETMGLTTAAAVDIDTLAERLRYEVAGAGGIVVVPPLVAAWTRMPS